MRPAIEPKAAPYGALAARVMLFLVAVAAPAAASEPVRQQVLAHATVALTITPFVHEAAAADDMIRAEPSHHLVVVLRDRKTDAPIPGAHVRIDVAEKGFAGVSYTLNPETVGGVPAYAASVVMPGRTLYRILVHVMLPRVDRVLEAQFEYRHHH